jgi:uncharacterized protein YbjT (DUF2867 family)
MMACRIMVIGATGFIGATVAARLASEGYEVAGLSRGPSPTSAGHIEFDIAKATTPEAWLPLLGGIAAVVNCAGTLQDVPGESTTSVHDTGPAALFAACEKAGIKRVIHVSAAGVERETPSAFSASKRRGEQALMTTGLEWIILRPSVVIGRGAYGGSALMRGLAALPVLPTLPGTGPLQLVHLDDVVDAVVFFLKPDAPSRQAYDLVGRRRYSFDESVRIFRRWMRWPSARSLRVPAWAAASLYRVGDVLGQLGWKTPVRTTARLEMVRGATGDPEPWLKAASREARDVEKELRREPASVQERWFSKLYILKPLIFGVFGAFWLTTGVISLGPGWAYGMELLREGGLPERFAALTVIAGALADIVIGLAILYRPTSRYGLYAALAISLVYVVIGTSLVPRLWADPLGPMLKIWPVLVLNLVALAILEDR